MPLHCLSAVARAILIVLLFVACTKAGPLSLDPNSDLPGSLEGSLRDGRGLPVEATISLTFPGREGETRVFPTREDGTWGPEVVTVGTWEVRPTSLQHLPTVRQVAVRPGQRYVIDIVLEDR